MRKPRPFSHKLIYVDERQERLRDLEQRMRQRERSDASSDCSLAHLQGVFTAAQKRRGEGRGVPLSVPMLLSVLLILLAVVLIIAYSK